MPRIVHFFWLLLQSEELLLALLGVVLVVMLYRRKIAFCLRFSPWLVPLMFAVDGVLLFGFGYAGVILFVFWQLWVLFTAARWDPVLELFRMPRWPRVPYLRGPGRHRPREFSEPLPWTRGPFTR